MCFSLTLNVKQTRQLSVYKFRGLPHRSREAHPALPPVELMFYCWSEMIDLCCMPSLSLMIWFVCLFVCLGLTSLWNIWGHITTVPACSSGALTNVLTHRNAMPQTQDTTPHPVTVYRHVANLSLCYPSMWNVTLEYTATHFNVLGETRPGNPSPTFHTHQRTFNLMLSWWSTVGSSVESTVPTGSWTRDMWCANPVRYPLAHSDFLLMIWKTMIHSLINGCDFVNLKRESLP